MHLNLNPFTVEPKYELVPHEFAKDDPASYEHGELEGRGFVLQRICDKQRLWRPPTRDGLACVMVAGVSFRNAQLQDQSFAPGKALELVPEPATPHDANAIGVWNSTHTLQIGYIPKATAAKLAEDPAARGELLGCLSLWEYRVKGQRVALRILLVRQRARVRGLGFVPAPIM